MSEILGKDVRIYRGDIQFSTSQDFSIVSEEKNLEQAIYNRLQTIQGEFYNLQYGSELNNCFGNPRDELLRTQIIGYIGECLRQEPRVAEVNDITITYPENEKHTVSIEISVTPIDSQVELNLVFPLFI